MRKQVGVLLALVLVAGMVVTVNAADKANVGLLLTKIAGSMNLGAATPAEAETALRGAGYSLPSLDLNAELTEGAVVDISRSLGLNVSTSNPTQPFTSEQVDEYVSTFGSNLDAGGPAEPIAPEAIGNNGNGADPLTKGKGKKKGLIKRSPSDPV